MDDSGSGVNINVSRYAENKNLIQVANLSENESKFTKVDTNEMIIVRALERLPPNLAGVLITFFIYMVEYNAFSILETLLAPLLSDTTKKYI